MQEYGIRDNQDKEDVHHPLEKELISAASYSYKLRNSGKKVIKYDVVLENKNTHESWQTKKETSSPVYIFGKGIPCPEIMKLKENVVMSSTEESCKFAMKLKYAALSYSDFVSAYKQVRLQFKFIFNTY